MALIKCNECGQTMSDKANVCPNCGAPVIKISTCSECGKELPAGAKACPACGAPVGTTETQNVRPNTMRPTVEQEAASDKIKKRVQYFLMNNKKYLPENRIPQLRERMLALNEEQLQSIECISFKDPTMLLIISIFIGEFGVDRFMLGDVGLGVAKLLITIFTMFVFGGWIWWLIDLFFVMNKTREFNYKKVEETFALLEFQ